MRNFWVLSLAFLIFAVVMLSHVPDGLALFKDREISRFAYMKSGKLNGGNAVEVDGMRFEIIVPERVWVIPINQPNAETYIEVNLRITNQNQKPVRFHLTTPVLRVMKPDGSEFRASGGREGHPYSVQFICRTLLPDESLIFSPNAKLFWRNNKLYLQGNDGVNGIWIYQGLDLGTYQIRFLFIGLLRRALCPDPKNTNSVERNFQEGFWTGQVATPFVEVKLVGN